MKEWMVAYSNSIVIRENKSVHTGAYPAGFTFEGAFTALLGDPPAHVLTVSVLVLSGIEDYVFWRGFKLLIFSTISLASFSGNCSVCVASML